jgi:hypothetical protein
MQICAKSMIDFCHPSFASFFRVLLYFLTLNDSLVMCTWSCLLLLMEGSKILLHVVVVVWTRCCAKFQVLYSCWTLGLQLSVSWTCM